VRWTLVLDPDGRPGRDNMRIDNGLLHAAGEGVGFLRLYRWNPPCLSFGRNEPATTRYDRAKIAALGVDTVRRPTGGRAVWHDAELTYAVAAPCRTFGSLRTTYTAIHDMLVAALGRLGVAATVASRPSGRAPRPSAGACFAAPVGGEIVVGGRKLVGSAQVRTGDAFLQHGSILLEDGQDLVSRITTGSVPPLAATSLHEVLGRAVAFGEVAQAIGLEAAQRWPGTWHSAERSPHIDGGDKFGDGSWTWRR
jgi:lipoate-protein ligase A